MKDMGETSSTDSGILSNPLSFTRSGAFYWNDASLGYRGGWGNYWSSRSESISFSGHLNFGSTYLASQGNSLRGLGFAVRS